jgi:calcineurin-like phosphoesterase family protein
MEKHDENLLANMNSVILNSKVYSLEDFILGNSKLSNRFYSNE